MVWYGMVWYGRIGRLASIMRKCGTPGCELDSGMRCGDLGLAPSQMVSSLFRPSCALDEVDNRFVTQLAQHLGRVRQDPRSLRARTLHRLLNSNCRSPNK